MTASSRTSSTGRVFAVLILLVAGIFSLPVAALLLDRDGVENWIMPAQLVSMAVIGAGVAWVLPLAGRDASPVRRSLIGAACGIGMAVLGLAVFWILLNGLRGA